MTASNKTSWRARIFYAGIGAAIVALIAGLLGYLFVDGLRVKEDAPIDMSKLQIHAPQSVPILTAVGKSPAEASEIFHLPNAGVEGDPVVVPLNSQTEVATAKISQVCFNGETRKLVFEVANREQLSDAEWRMAGKYRNMKDLQRLVSAGCSTTPLVTGIDIS